MERSKMLALRPRIERVEHCRERHRDDLKRMLKAASMLLQARPQNTHRRLRRARDQRMHAAELPNKVIVFLMTLVLSSRLFARDATCVSISMQSFIRPSRRSARGKNRRPHPRFRRIKSIFAWHRASALQRPLSERKIFVGYKKKAAD
ncbi:MAG: hypothetical protein ACLP8A_14480 [Methylovirgula sp.]